MLRSFDSGSSHLGALCAVLLPLLAAAPLAASDEAPTFVDDIAPIFFENCVSCHRPNDVAPMSLLTYQEARPWAKSILRMVSTGEMPPWDADPRYGVWGNDASLAPEEIALVERWVQAGAPAGDLAKMPPAPEQTVGWKMGEEPDLVVELREIAVPADGPDLFVTQIAGLEVPEGKWVRAIELLPGNTEVLHHVVTYLGPFGMNDGDGDRDGDDADDDGYEEPEIPVLYVNEAGKRETTILDRPSVGSVWVAGAPPTIFREGTGHELKTDQIVSFNMHYHPSGNAGADRTKVGFYYGDGELEKSITTAFALNAGLVIQPGDAHHTERAVYLFPQESDLLSFLPHMHQRGKSMTYTLEYPDGSSEIALSVPEYDYDWQNIYRFAEPKRVPAGTRLVVDAAWDNSADNPANPDPTIEVPFGDGTTNEMLVAFVDFVPAEGKSLQRVNANQTVERLLAFHDPARAYAVGVEGMGFAPKWGLVLPSVDAVDEADFESQGWFYLAFGELMFSSSFRDFWRLENGEVLFNSNTIVSAGGTPAPVGFVGRVGDEGVFEGEVFFGKDVTPEVVDELRGTGRSFRGQSMAARETAATAAAR